LRVDQLKDQLPTRGWQLRSAGRGAKGLRMHAWAWMALDSSGVPEGWRRSLLIRRDRESEDEYAYFLCYHRRGVGLGELVGVAGRRWGVEECFATAKSEAGLDQHQVRTWTAWYRHTILSMPATAFLAVTAARIPANAAAWTAG
jgi:SRSO17 transposase